MNAMYRKLVANNALYGLVCVLIATLGLSFKAILIKLVYSSDPTIDAATVLMLRFLFALPFFILILWFAGQKTEFQRIAVKDIAILFVLGVVGFYVSAILDFAALTYISASIERLILFLYPTFVVIISLFVRPEEISARLIVALLLSYVGIVIVFAGQTQALASNEITGAFMVFSAALVFAVYTVMSVKPIREHGSIRFTAYAMLSATAASVTHTFSTHSVSVLQQSMDVYLLILLMAVFSTVLPLLLMAEGVKRIGASSSSVISTSGPPITLGFAFVFLGESMTPVQLAGSVFVLAGVFFVTKAYKKQ